MIDRDNTLAATVERLFDIPADSFRRMNKLRRERFDSAVARICNVDYMGHGLDVLDGIPLPANLASTYVSGLKQERHLVNFAPRLHARYLAARQAQRSGDKIRFRQAMLAVLAEERAQHRACLQRRQAHEALKAA